MVKVGGSFRITIPMEIVTTLNIKDKEQLEIWLDDSRIIMVKTETNVKPA
jgi:bifunctional DNA-binding transcriptional regulator/antitoxin component of YhaV-PrlF toxin-antitoxin module